MVRQWRHPSAMNNLEVIKTMNYLVVKKTNSCYLIWDFENLKVPNDLNIRYFDAVQNLENGLKNLLDNINITDFKVCGNSTASSTSAVQRWHTYLGGAKLEDVPVDETPDASDKEIVIEIVKYVRFHPPPGFICLMSGDEDMFQILGWVGDRGYTTVLLTPEDESCSRYLCQNADYCIRCRDLFVETFPNEDPKPLIKRYPYDEECFDTIVFWDAIGCAHVHQEAVIRYIKERVLREIGGGSIQIRVYIDMEKLPARTDRLRGVRYVGTTRDKATSLENKIFCDLVTCGAKPRLPKNVVLISNSQEFSRGLLFLKRLEIQVHLVFRYVTPGLNVLSEEQRFQMSEAEGSLLFYWPPPEQEIRYINDAIYNRGGGRHHNRGGRHHNRGGRHHNRGGRHHNRGGGHYNS